MFKPSPYQQAITTWTREGRGNAIVNAVAGAGKTSTVGLVASEITGTKVYLVFNKHNQISAEKKLGHTGLHVFTCHSFGYRILRANASIANRKIDKNKYRNLVRDLAKADRKFAALDRDEQWEILSPAFKLVDLGRNDLVDPRSEGAEDRLHEVADHHALVLPLGYAEFIMGLVIGALRSGMGKRDGDGQVRLGAVDFGDMLWIPAMYEMREKTYQWVLVDECQDLSAAQRYVAFAAMGKGARMLAVGDPRQAIFGFAGADSSSFAKLAAQADATELPLSVCYRCPRAVVKLAASIVPQIEAAPDAPEGKVTRVREDDVDEMVVEGDMILCRITIHLDHDQGDVRVVRGKQKENHPPPALQNRLDVLWHRAFNFEIVPHLPDSAHYTFDHERTATTMKLGQKKRCTPKGRDSIMRPATYCHRENWGFVSNCLSTNRTMFLSSRSTRKRKFR